MTKKLLAFCFLLGAFAFAEEVFPIMAWNWVGEYKDGATSVEFYKDMKDCGFSLAGMASTPEQLEAIRQAGIQCLWIDGDTFSNQNLKEYDVAEWEKKVIPVVEKYKDDPVVYGFYVRDEPNGDEVDGALKMADIVQAAAPNKMVYLNLYSNSTEQWRLDPFNYWDYAEKIYSSGLRVSGFDQYVFYHDGHMRHTFYESMKIHRDLCQKYGKQWWFCGLTIAHRYYATPTFTQLAHQAFSALAYGAKGLSWYKYGPSVHNGWHSSPLNVFFDKTPVWYELKLVNRTVQNYAYVLNHLKSDRVYHFGSTVPETDERVNGPDEGSLITGMKNSNNWLVGEFTHEQTGDRWLIIVNKNLEAPVKCEPIFREGKQPVKMTAIREAEPVEQPFTPQADNITLRPGAGVLVHLYYEK